ncbi:5-oxoprolinase subunit PxpA [Polaribacter litorisediminis]|uniref:5-oxoprolinase subunit PxpA n=1 Tax=Polaribacter litorisediminis TaxID=1908341 RepID=UPI001CBC42EB|nr:5-oxoprolinase subunit PxpA [Polaribacter litorisediminis]UAM97121.1 5-oxoprolinase subunit PxpA [Polaribacter litorisediminis]
MIKKIINSIDINCDVGEGMNNEHLLMPHISSCSIACGGHFGTVKSIDKAIELARAYQVKIGAHPSFPDTENFGRKLIPMSEAALKTSIQNQLNLFLKRVSFFNEKLHHIKPHGALYNAITVDENLANLFVNSIKIYMKDVFLYVPYNSFIEKVALQNSIKIKYEAFADRNYNDDLTLVSRNEKNALITHKQDVFKHVFNMAKNGKVQAISSLEKQIKVDTFCIHGDTENAIEIAAYVSENLKKEGFKID